MIFADVWLEEKKNIQSNILNNCSEEIVFTKKSSVFVSFWTLLMDNEIDGETEG